jgi:starvation-inducible outer membrane lipoprotein
MERGLIIHLKPIIMAKYNALLLLSMVVLVACSTIPARISGSYSFPSGGRFRMSFARRLLN